MTDTGKPKLSMRERRFLSLYLKFGCNATKAYRKLSPGIAISTAESEGSKLLSRIKKKKASPMLSRPPALTTITTPQNSANSSTPKRPSFTKVFRLPSVPTTILVFVLLSCLPLFAEKTSLMTTQIQISPKPCASLSLSSTQYAASNKMRVSIYSDKQKEFIREATGENTHRWNIKSGATRSGKTYLDYHVLPMRIMERHGERGLNVILGNTKETIRRNIIDPLRQMWGSKLVSGIGSDNVSHMFGDDVYCLGAEKINAVDRIRGSSWKYLYGDEFVTWHPDVFTMAKSRLDRHYSCADLTNNPDNPNHWAYKFIHSDADIYLQEYTIDDNPFNDPVFVENLKREYLGTVFYDRYILGRWVRAEGVCYPTFRHNKGPNEPGNVLYATPQGIRYVTLGIDFGGHKSSTVFVCTGWYLVKNSWSIVALDYEKIKHNTENGMNAIGPDELNRRWYKFQKRCFEQWPIQRAFGDSAEQILIKGLNQIPRSFHVENAMKRPILERLRAANMLYAQGRKNVMASCEELIEAIENAVYDEKASEDERLDDGSSDIDSLDADEYTWERFISSQLLPGMRFREDA